VRPQIRQGWLATNLRCSLERCHLGSPIGRALLSIPFWAIVEIAPSLDALSSAPASAVWVLGFTRVVAQLFKWFTRSFARSGFTFPICFNA
jgi:hypothetical protein